MYKDILKECVLERSKVGLS